MKINLEVLDKIDIPILKSKVLSYLWNIQNLAHYEPKVSSIRVFPESNRHGTYIARGWFSGVPWKGKFSYKKNKDGFFSQILTRPMGVLVEGGFAVKAKNKRQSELIHFEHYQFPFWFFPLFPWMKIYLKITLKQELLKISYALDLNQKKN